MTWLQARRHRAPMAILGGLALALAAWLAIGGRTDPPPAGIDPARIRAACDQYAALDLSGWATICRDAGYQQTSMMTRCVHPEDLDRTDPYPLGLLPCPPPP